MSAPVFDPIGRPPRLTDRIADKLTEAIVAGQFRVGDNLPSEREVGAQFGVSRTVVREAIRSLVTKGLLDVQSGRGARVARLDSAPLTEAMSLLVRGTPDIDFAKLHEIRTMLETHTVEAAARRATDDDIRELEAVYERMAGADGEAAAELDVEFHRAIARATHNELHLVLLDSIGENLLEVRRATLAIPHDAARRIDEHRRIVEAIGAHDPARARAAMEEHLRNVAEAWSRR